MPRTIYIFSIFLAALGCTKSSDIPERRSEAPPEQPDRSYYQTIVTLTPNGPQVSGRLVTKEEQTSRIKIPPARGLDFAPIRDTGCAGSSLWIFDQPGGTG